MDVIGVTSMVKWIRASTHRAVIFPLRRKSVSQLRFAPLLTGSVPRAIYDRGRRTRLVWMGVLTSPGKVLIPRCYP